MLPMAALIVVATARDGAIVPAARALTSSPGRGAAPGRAQGVTAEPHTVAS